MHSFLRSKRATNLFQRITLGSSFPVSKTANGDRMVINANLRAKIFKCLWHRAPAKLLSLLLFWRTEHLHFQCLLSVSLFGYYCTPTVLPTRPNGPLCPRGVWQHHTSLPQPWNDQDRVRFLNVASLLFYWSARLLRTFQTGLRIGVRKFPHHPPWVAFPRGAHLLKTETQFWVPFKCGEWGVLYTC